MGYPLILYRDWGLKDFGDGTYQAACAVGPVIIIRPEKRNDSGLVAHELTHVAQWAFGVFFGLLLAFALATLGGPGWQAVAGFSIGFHAVLYAVAPEYREWAEVRAYRRQLRCYPDDRRELFAKFLAQRYGLNLTEAEAREKLS